jgi:hypothetical protein
MILIYVHKYEILLYIYIYICVCVCGVELKRSENYFIKMLLYCLNVLKIILGIININVVILLNFIEYKSEIIYNYNYLY